MVKLQEVTITKVKRSGSNCIHYNVDLNGHPFGQIWTFKAKHEVHPYHVKTLAGFYANFTTYKDAERAIRGQM